MKAMILAAGLGTRLRPLTDSRPKALVEVAGRTLLEITLTRLRDIGILDVIINTHHFAEMMEGYLKKNRDFGMRIEISREETLLDTGGGLKKAAYFFKRGDSSEPFLLHNVDVISNIDIHRMLEWHKEQGALATLAVQERKTSRYLVFDANGYFRDRQAAGAGSVQPNVPGEHTQALAFSGIHIISRRLLSMMSEQGAFSIIDTYVRLAAAGEKITAFRADAYEWRDLGKPENVEKAAEDLERKRVVF